MTLRLACLILLTGFAPPAAFPKLTKLDVPGLPNVIGVHAKVLSGGQPEGEQAFARLAALGVKTIISVDGMRPDVEAARMYGLRYVHLPHGYDGVPEVRAMELAKAVRDLPGRIYIHCHHGKHRSPAAAAVACVGAGLLDPSQAEDVLRLAGTGTQYLGLFESARRSRAYDSDLLDRLNVDFKEVVPLPPLAKAMVEIDILAEGIGKLERTGWKQDAPHEKPASHAALLLHEQYRELLRDPAIVRRPKEFVQLLRAAEASAADLETALKRHDGSRNAEVAARWRNVQQNCAACHSRFRDIPQPLRTP